MFNVQINENEYIVFGERELNFIGNTISNVVTCQNYYTLETIPGQNPAIKYTNIEPVIIDKNSIEYNNLNGQTTFSFGLPLSIEEYEALYELHLKQLEENPTLEYQNIQRMKQDVETAKTLVKNRKERK